MIKKLEKLWEKIESFMQIIITLVLFLTISLLIFIFLKDAKVFNNTSLNLFTLVIFFLAIYLFIINLYYKIHKFILMKPLIDEKEFNKLWKKRYNLARKLQKLKRHSKEYKEKGSQFDKITKTLEKNTIKFKSWFVFFIFSVYLGILQAIPFWAIKHSVKYFPEATKHFFRTKPYEIGFMWYKTKDNIYSIDSFIYLPKKFKK